jgi:uncharacterized protein
MKLDRDNSAGNVIRRFSGGEIQVGDLIIRQPVIVTVDRIITAWTPGPIGQLLLTDLQPILDLEPEVILLGTGPRQIFPPPAVSTAILQLGVGLEVMDTAAACRTFNVLVAEYRRVVAGLVIE